MLKGGFLSGVNHSVQLMDTKAVCRFINTVGAIYRNSTKPIKQAEGRDVMPSPRRAGAAWPQGMHRRDGTTGEN